MHRFTLELIDAALGCPVLAVRLLVSDLDALRVLLRNDASEDVELTRWYILDPEDVTAVSERFELGLKAEGRKARLSRVPEADPDPIPYLIHTGYELPLMLDGVKLLAFFHSWVPPEPDDFPEEALFEPHVQSGSFSKRVVGEPFPQPFKLGNGRSVQGMRHVIYARRGEEWRIDAHLLLHQQSRWNETLERLQGTLLGYTEEQNDLWAARRRRHSATSNFSDRTAYATVNEGSLDWIHEVGERALPSTTDLELMMHWPRPSPSQLDHMLSAEGAHAVVRFGLRRDFLDSRKHYFHRGVRCYLVRQEEIVLLNRSLVSPIEILHTTE